ncbi:hypothetical protein ACHAXR_004163 [Thalassiosira sp. AJA248-18]
MSSSNETDREKDNGPKQNNDANNNNPMATSSTKDDTKPPKKKKPIQHLLAGGTAGFVESSICHPLDTIKTRMQLRRQDTNKMRKRALSSMREVGGTREVVGKGALHRKADAGKTEVTKAATKAADAGASKDGTAATKNDGLKSTTTNKAKNETATVRVKPEDASKAKSAATSAAKPKPTSTTTATKNALHDVGWKQRLPSSTASTATASAETASKTIASTATKSAATASASAASSSPGTVVATLGPFGTAQRIVQREGPLALYKGLTAVYTGIVPKMAIRFVSFEYYRDVLGGWYGQYAGISYNASVPATSSSTIIAPPTPPPGVTFFAGLLSGLTEAIMIVTPAEVCKIRMQSQYHSLMDPAQIATRTKYKNVVQTALLVVKEEGLGALYKGVVPTMLRQGCNQAVNFTVYNWSKKRVLAWKKQKAEEKAVGGGDNVQLDHWQSLTMGGLSGGMGPLVNNPLDVVKTRMQKQVIHPGKEPKYKSLSQSCIVIAKEEGTPALWKGITPRLMRIMPGQAITFMTYEAVSAQMEKYGMFD